MNAAKCHLSTIALLATGLVTLLSGSIPAQSSQSKSKMGLSTLDKTYLKDTAQSNLEEVQLAPVVASNATAAPDRLYGKRMKQDHARANAELTRLARRVGNPLPDEISDDQKALIKKFSHLHGPMFTAAYKQEMVRDHTEDIAKTKREISLGTNPLVKANAQKTLRLLQMHLTMAHALPSSTMATKSARM